MKPRAPHPRRLDVAAFAEAGESLQGELPLSALARLGAATVAPPAGEAVAPVAWSIQGRAVRRAGRIVERRLAVAGRTRVWLQCQRCLEPMATELDVARSATFVDDEDSAATLDAQSDDDVLALSATFDALEWLEDELLLGLPLVPRHDDCAAPRGADRPEGDAPAAPDDPAQAARPNPFAALAVLKAGKPDPGSER